MLACRDEWTQETDGGAAAELFVEGLVAVAAQAAVARGFFAAVAASDSGQRRVEHVTERAGDADGAAGAAGDCVEDDKEVHLVTGGAISSI